MVPEVNGKYPVIVLSNEVLPDPFAPRTTQCWPASTCQSMRSRMTASRSTWRPISMTVLLTCGPKIPEHYHRIIRGPYERNKGRRLQAIGSMKGAVPDCANERAAVASFAAG